LQHTEAIDNCYDLSPRLRFYVLEPLEAKALRIVPLRILFPPHPSATTGHRQTAKRTRRTTRGPVNNDRDYW